MWLDWRLGTPIAMDQLAYTEEEAIEKVGIVLSAGCVLTALSFISSGPIAKRYQLVTYYRISNLKNYFFTIEFRITERKAIVMCGLIPLLISNIILLPYSGPTPLMQRSSHNSKHKEQRIINIELTHWNSNWFLDISEEHLHLNGSSNFSGTLLTVADNDLNVTQGYSNVSRHIGNKLLIVWLIYWAKIQILLIYIFV